MSNYILECQLTVTQRQEEFLKALAEVYNSECKKENEAAINENTVESHRGGSPPNNRKDS